MNAEASVFEEKALNSQTFLLAAKPGLLLDRASFSLKFFIFFYPCHASLRCQQPPPCKCHFQDDLTSGQFLGVFNQIPACVDKLKWPIRLVWQKYLESLHH